MCLNYAQRIWIKLLFPTPLCWMLLNIISWSVMILHRLRRTTQKQLSILSLKIFSYLRRNASYLRSSLMAFVGPFTLVVDWRSHHNPVWGMSGMCLGSWEAGADPTDHMSDGSWYRGPGDNHLLLPISSPASSSDPGQGPTCDQGLDTRSFYFLWTYSFCEDDTIDLLKRVDSIQTQRRRGQDSWIALKKL